MVLTQLVYLSRSIYPMEQQDLDSICKLSMRNNSRCGLTGVLVYIGGNFMQLLEGDAKAIAATYSRIEQDVRHKDCRVLSLAPAAERMFPDWLMKAFSVQDLPDDMRSVFVQIILDAETPGQLQMNRVFAFLKTLKPQAEPVSV